MQTMRTNFLLFRTPNMAAMQTTYTAKRLIYSRKQTLGLWFSHLLIPPPPPPHIQLVNLNFLASEKWPTWQMCVRGWEWGGPWCISVILHLSTTCTHSKDPLGFIYRKACFLVCVCALGERPCREFVSFSLPCCGMVSH